MSETTKPKTLTETYSLAQIRFTPSGDSSNGGDGRRKRLRKGETIVEEAIDFTDRSYSRRRGRCVSEHSELVDF